MNLISFFEIPASDFDRAVKFYENVFGITLNRCEGDGEKMAFFPAGSNAEGAISQHESMKPSPDGVTLTFGWDGGIDEFLARAEKAGGKTLRPKTKIEAENRGYFALFADTEGNRLGVYSEK
ncbi:MAG: VOC family protein [Candidatus Kapaibacterium sp.]